MEPSGDAFNSIVFDERNHRPFNPMVNAGALVTTDLVRGKDADEKLERILGVLRHSPEIRASTSTGTSSSASWRPPTATARLPT